MKKRDLRFINQNMGSLSIPEGIVERNLRGGRGVPAALVSDPSDPIDYYASAQSVLGNRWKKLAEEVPALKASLHAKY